VNLGADTLACKGFHNCYANSTLTRVLPIDIPAP
jgi:hypothetical protein